MTKEIKEKIDLSKLDKGVIIVKPNLARKVNSLVTDPEHEAYFLMGTANISYSLPKDSQGNLVNPFRNKEEKEWLENELDLDLNHHKNKDNFWKKFSVKMNKDSKSLNLENPKHYLEYIIMRANSLYFAPTLEDARKRATYRYIMTTLAAEATKQANKADLEIEAFMFLGKLKETPEEMYNFLKVYGKKVSIQSKPQFLVTELRKIITEDVEGFLKIANDKEVYNAKLLIEEAVEVGALTKKGRQYFLPGGDNLSSPGEPSTIDNAVKFLNYAGNQDILLQLQTRVKTAKD